MSHNYVDCKVKVKSLILFAPSGKSDSIFTFSLSGPTNAVDTKMSKAAQLLQTIGADNPGNVKLAMEKFPLMLLSNSGAIVTRIIYKTVLECILDSTSMSSFI